MKVLALDLSTRRGSVACAEDDALLYEHEWTNDRRTAAPFFEAIAQVTAGIGQPEMIVVGLGPGSYTGTRIAISTAIGLAGITGAPLFGLPSIVALAGETHFAAIGDARRATFFFARIRDQDLSSAPELLTREEMTERLRLAKIPVYSSDELPDFPGAILSFPCASLLLKIARARPQNLVRAPLAPLYLREPHITT